MDAVNNMEFLSEFVVERLGLPVFGAARAVAPVESVLDTCSEEILPVAKTMSFAVVLGHPLSLAVLETVIDRPTIIYKHHYQQVNWRLDRAAVELSQKIGELGARALPIPASIIVDYKNQRGHLSHRHAALAAGLGWKGRHGLVVTPEYGAQIRWATVLTDLPLIAGSPMERDCGGCVACIKPCPANAISKGSCDVERCFAKLDEFARTPGIGHHICGICIRECKGQR